MSNLTRLLIVLIIIPVVWLLGVRGMTPAVAFEYLKEQFRGRVTDE